MTTLVLDNGAYNAKIGYSHDNVSVIPNCQFRSKTARLKTFTANQIDEIKDPSGLFYILPFQKGYLVNWDVQRQVWDYLFGKEMYQVDFLDTNIIITEPYFNFTSIQESMNEILFEEYQFQAVLRVNAGALSAHRYFRDNPSELCCIIVDSGYSFTHIVPYCRSKKKKEAIIRINVGGKLLTNHLKEIISYRQLHVMDETHVMNQVKEDVCYVSQDFYRDMEIAKLKGEDNTVMIDYVLPDFSTIKKGFCKPREEMVLSGKYKSGEQILRLANERFAVPEILFNPSDIGIQEMGIPEAIVYSIQNLPEEMQPHFFKNIVLTGGNSFFPGFRDRVYSEVRCLTPTDYDVSVVLPENPFPPFSLWSCVLGFCGLGSGGGDEVSVRERSGAWPEQSQPGALREPAGTGPSTAPPGSRLRVYIVQLKSAVMDNPVTREFDVGRHIASGGNGLAWKIFNGTKKSTKQEVAVFVFDKKLIDKYQKFEKNQIIDSLKRGVQQLTRLRHPRLLTVQHPLEESR
ncbi:ARP6 actin-related protein 6 [Cricetulus griseus]